MTETKPQDRSLEVIENIVILFGDVLMQTPTVREKEFVKLKGEQLLEELRKFHSMVKNY